MAEVASGPAGEAFKCTVSHIEREIGYLVRFRTNVASLKSKAEQLTATRNDLRRRINAGWRNNELIREAVGAWILRVDAVEVKATQLNAEAVLIDRWFKGWFCSRFILGRKAVRNIAVVQQLLVDTDSFGDGVSHPIPVQDLVEFRDSTTSNDHTQTLISTVDFWAFASRERITKQLIGALKDDNIRVVGVFGMPGVGKTTLIKELAKHVKKEKIFNDVVMVTVVLKLDVKKIQDDVANGLGLQFEDNDTLLVRAARLTRRLNQSTKTLIIFDNVWDELKLAQVGIPSSTNCTVIFTTRSQSMCHFMEAGEIFQVGILSEEDSWHLFRQKAGYVADTRPLRIVAREIVNECQGLPLAIVPLGRTLRGCNDPKIWAHALRQLQRSYLTGIVFSCIKLSYDHLQGEEYKMCFLFCGLFPDGYPISMDQLLSYVMGEKLLGNVENLEEAMDFLHAIVGKLTSSCLLLKTESGCIRMHDVVRDVAISIASDPTESYRFIVRAGMRLREWPDNINLVKCKRLSLMNTDTVVKSSSSMSNTRIWSNLLNGIIAAHLLTLSLHGNEDLIEIPRAFFENMRGLLTLDLSYTGIKELPQSLECLVNLRTFRLTGCRNLKSVCLSNKLVRLEILSLRYSNIELFCISGKITNLKLLDLSYTQLKMLEANVISAFPRLEELCVFKTAWGSGQSVDFIALLSDVLFLNRLTSLELHIQDLKCLSKEIQIMGILTRFKIVVATTSNFRNFEIADGMQFERSLYLELQSNLVANWVKVLLARTNFLYLHNCEGLESVVQFDPCQNQVGTLHTLRVLEKQASTSGTSLIHDDSLERLHNLQKLVVHQCDGLEKLIEFEALEKQASTSTMSIPSDITLPSSPKFPNLTYLEVRGCGKLKYLFPMRVIREMLQLEKLYIYECSNMEIIIVHENAEDDRNADEDEAIFPLLQILRLDGLPCLSNFVRSDLLVDWPSLEELTVKGCSGLKKLPFGPRSVPKLTKFTADPDWLDQLDWEDESLKLHLEALLPWSFCDLDEVEGR